MYPTPVHQSMEHQSNRYDEFITVIDSLGRRWNPLLHPRDSKGRFIRTFSYVSFNLPGGLPGDPHKLSGRVSGVDRDGYLLVKVQNVDPSLTTKVGKNDYVRIKADQVEVKTIKGRIRLSNNDAADAPNDFTGRLNRLDAGTARNGVKTLNRQNLGDTAKKLDQAVRLAEAEYSTKTDRDRAAAAAAKQRAIDLFREVGEEVAAERGKGFAEGDDYEQIKATLTGAERRRLDELDKVIAGTFTARQAIGDRTLELDSDSGKIPAKAPERRIGVIENELQKDQAEGAKVWDISSGTLVETTLDGVQKATVRDTVAEEQPDENVLPGLERATFQRLRSGMDRSAGFKQQEQVAPGSRWHVDKTGENEVRVGTIVDVDAGRSRRAYTGIVTRLYTNKQGEKKIFVRDFVRGDDDPIKSDPTYSKGYRDYQVVPESIEVSGANNDNNLFEQLGSQGVSPKSLIEAFTEEYVTARRLAGPGAKRISPTSGNFFDSIPVQDRVRMDANGESLKIGDHVAGPNGEIGVVTYIEPNTSTTKVEYPNGQAYVRLSSARFTRLHGPTSDIFIQDDTQGKDNNYIPTRDEAADIAEEMGATSVAEAIRSGGDHVAIKDAMIADPAFQEALQGTTDLFDRRDQTLSSGKELADEDRDALARWEKMMASSAGIFREGEPAPPRIPVPPSSDGEEAPQDPSNPERRVEPGGEGEEGEEPEQEAPETDVDPLAGDGLAQKMTRDIQTLIAEAKRSPTLRGVQGAQMDKHLGVLTDAIVARDSDAFIAGLRAMNKEIHSNINRNLRETRLAALLRGQKTGGKPMADFVQAKVDAGSDIFGTAPATPVDRPESSTDETPDGVPADNDRADADLAESLLGEEGDSVIMRGDEVIDEGFYIVKPDSARELDAAPTPEEIAGFIEEMGEDEFDGISIWRDDNGRFHMAKVRISDDETEIKQEAESSGANQYVNIADGSVHNIAGRETDDEEAPESIEDSRSEERVVRKSGNKTATPRTTTKQRTVLDKVAELPDAPTDVIDKVKNGEEIEGADASRLADFINSSGADKFDKPADKGVAQQLADRIARATGETGPRPYSSQNTALRRTSDVGISLDALSQNDEIRGLTAQAREDIKNGDNAAAADKFRQAADIFEGMGIPNQGPVTRAREHADRLMAAESTSEATPEAEVPEAPTATGPDAASITWLNEMADEATDPAAPIDLRFVRALTMQSRLLDQPITTADEFAHVGAEMASIMHALNGLRDPASRLGLHSGNMAMIPSLVDRLDAGMVVISGFFSSYQGDVEPLKAALRAQLDKNGAGDLLDFMDAPDSAFPAFNKAAERYMYAKGGSGDLDVASRAVVEASKPVLEAGLPKHHRLLAGAIGAIFNTQLASNNGKVPDWLRQEFKDPVWDRFGAFGAIKKRLDMEDVLDADGPEAVATATNGEYTAITWDGADQLQTGDLTTDDREQASNPEADTEYERAMSTFTPNIAKALNSLWGSLGGAKIRRVQSNIAEISGPVGEAWRREGWSRNTGGADTRAPNQVGGVFSKSNNMAVVADESLTGRYTSVVHHELGHALDSMLGELFADGSWFTSIDDTFIDYHAKLRDMASYGRSPEQSIMHWYFRDGSEGAAKHNGVVGNKEVFAEGHAAYLWGKQYFANMEETGAGGAVTKDTGFALMARALTQNEGEKAILAGQLDMAQVRKMEVAMGKAIFEYYENLENTQLPEIMESGPQVAAVTSELRDTQIAFEGAGVNGTPAPYGLIEGQVVQSIGGPPVEGLPAQPDAAPVPVAVGG